MTEQMWIEKLGLEAHPEGGYFKQTNKSEQLIPAKRGERALHTAILFLLNTESPSHFHRLKADELWFFHDGQPLTVHCIFPDGTYQAVQLGKDLVQGQQLSLSVPAGTIFGSTVATGFALVSCVVTPGFEFEDFELFTQAELLNDYPQHSEIIQHLAYRELP
ncbi:cupin family protein [Enterococcus faecalis ERV65]|uniref:Cupin family protein n=2 Tax=Enterococcus faecalis TaxID=1351 RepID=A0AAV3GJ27_ENTFL|nr:cupin domain-containing protein [Enterococcus faecalis]EEI13207.1 cupin family protein [Enterococcus faecalis TX0104]EJU94656.1 cupin family protein [Enterococcus faecalis ERV25]EJU95132.1 cupin family protein [Enterococcus faecalis ERV129]EJU97037.1 cupin family protein [Enterococcus faecalis ERV31]EJV05545.1 cupin family protein [Enterococcus faecalis ERV37]